MIVVKYLVTLHLLILNMKIVVKFLKFIQQMLAHVSQLTDCIFSKFFGAFNQSENSYKFLFIVIMT